MQFLIGLNDVYQPIRSTILAKDPLPNVKDAFYVVSKEESHRGLHPGGSGSNKSQPAAFVVKTNNNTNNFNRRVNTNNNNNTNRGPNPNLLCKNCGLIGHIVNRCYELIGYPASFKRNPNLSKQTENNNKRFNGNSKSESIMYNVTLGLIIYSGANQHMTDSTKDMFNIMDISSLMLTVGNPNGTLAKIIVIGSLRLTNGIVLFDVLVVPEYSDLKLGKIIGTGSEIGGLYLFDVSQNDCPPRFCLMGNTPNVEGNRRVASDDCEFIVEDEVATIATQIGVNVTYEGIVHNNQNGEDPTNVLETSPVLRRSSRQRNLPSKLNDFVVGKYVCYSKLFGTNFCFSTTLNKSFELKTYLEAFQNPKWVEAMHLEMEALHRNNTYVLKAIWCKWIWKIKYKSSGEVDRDLNEDVYMELPHGYYDKNETKVCKLVKSLYGLKQAPRKWNEKLTTALVKNGYFMGIEILENKNGMCLSQRKYCLELCEYGLLAGKPAATPLQKNVVLNHVKSGNDKFLPNMSEYQKIVGKLIYLSIIYLSITRPDISYAIHCLSQHMHVPLQSHFSVALRVLRYLKNAPGTGVQFYKGKSLSLHTFSDAGWAECPKTRKLVFSFCLYLCNNLISWKIKKQATIFRSSVESEYRCLASTTCELIGVVKFLKDLEVDGFLPVHLYYDSNSGIQIAVNPVFHEKTKHFEIDLHLVREKASYGVIKILKVASANNVADISTKGLGIAQHKEFCEKLGLVDMYKP
ncbi:ribonuclease H-like domain-containing protein [Tanacetum coccineum]